MSDIIAIVYSPREKKKLVAQIVGVLVAGTIALVMDRLAAGTALVAAIRLVVRRGSRAAPSILMLIVFPGFFASTLVGEALLSQHRSPFLILIAAPTEEMSKLPRKLMTRGAKTLLIMVKAYLSDLERQSWRCTIGSHLILISTIFLLWPFFVFYEAYSCHNMLKRFTIAWFVLSEMGELDRPLLPSKLTCRANRLIRKFIVERIKQELR